MDVTPIVDGEDRIVEERAELKTLSQILSELKKGFFDVSKWLFRFFSFEQDYQVVVICKVQGERYNNRIQFRRQVQQPHTIQSCPFLPLSTPIIESWHSGEGYRFSISPSTKATGRPLWKNYEWYVTLLDSFWFGTTLGTLQSPCWTNPDHSS